MRLWGIRSCDTTRKALAALEAAGHRVEFIDLRSGGIAPGLAARIVALSGERAINRASATWRALAPGDRAAPPADLLCRHPLLMKRPLIEEGGHWTQGWDSTVQAHWL
ncbi:MAG: arsenate reductase [Rubellimicrobium sp.]|nr:arsenate reductase [Rubellimicrobium sp.]